MRPTSGRTGKGNTSTKEPARGKRKREQSGDSSQSDLSSPKRKPIERKEKRIPSISLKVIDQEERGSAERTGESSEWFRGKFRAAHELKWFYVIVWGDTDQKKIDLFKKGTTLMLKNVTLEEERIIHIRKDSTVEKGASITVGKEIETEMVKKEEETYKSLDKIMKMNGEASKTKLRVCEPVKHEKERPCGGTFSRDVRVKDMELGKEHEITLFGEDAKVNLEKGWHIVVKIRYNQGKDRFESDKKFVMKIYKK